MRSIIAEHPEGALTLWPSPEERRIHLASRDAQLKALGPEGRWLALAFLIGYHPQAFDAALDAAEPSAEDGELALFR